jgi:branched-chain amino acid transport system substrate-binding protein
MKCLRFVSCLIAQALLLNCFPADAAPKQSVRVGAILMLSGDQAVYGKALLEGIELGLEEANANAKEHFSLIVEDSQLKPQVAHSAATKLLKVDRVTAALNASFIESMANGKVFESAKVPVITLWDSASEIERLGDYVFGIGLWTPSSASRASDFALTSLSARTAVIINTQAEWSETVAGLFEEYFAEGGGVVLKRISVSPKENDFRTLVHLAKNFNADVLYAPITENLVPFYKQLREVQFSKPIITSDIIAAEHINQAPRIFEGVYQTNAPEPEGEVCASVVALYRRKFKREPTLPLFVAWGYDGIRLLTSAISKVGPDSEKIKEYLYTVDGFPGASSRITFNRSGSSPVMERMFVIRGGKFELVESNEKSITKKGAGLQNPVP